MDGNRKRDSFELIAPKVDLLTYVKRGVLYVEKKPHYIVDLVKEHDVSFVLVYKVHPGTEKNPQPLAQEVVEKRARFSNNTRLGQLANRLFPSKAVKKWKPRPPAFIAPVLPNGRNTFTGETESGFFEREEDTVTVQGGERKFVRGRNTGVFIGLSSIVWEDKIRIPTDSILKVLRDHQRQDYFFDLEGHNDDTSNPLSTYYRGDNV